TRPGSAEDPCPVPEGIMDQSKDENAQAETPTRRLADIFDDLISVARSHKKDEDARKAHKWVDDTRKLILKKLEE
ncbi:hypothetical protein H0H93_003563, partial [Arthromyces matolae]